jgi:hypothetical protein
MIPTGVAVYVALEPVDMRDYSFRAPGGLRPRADRIRRRRVRCSSSGKRRDALKGALFFDGSGLCVFTSVLTVARSELPEVPAEGRGTWGDRRCDAGSAARSVDPGPAPPQKPDAARRVH